jgi:mannose-6-phosphate isomerase-like protein (cupin superfamily)
MMKENMPTRLAQTKIDLRMKIIRLTTISLILLVCTLNTGAQYLRRSVSAAADYNIALSSQTAHYTALFGEGTDSTSLLKGIKRYGILRIDPSGESMSARYDGEETVVVVRDGTGIIKCGKESLPVSKNDFMYIPSGTKFSFINKRDRTLSVFIMCFHIDPANPVKPSQVMKIASAEEVPFQVLGYHGPTTTFQLLMGTTESTRDKLAAACQVTSLFVMDFAAGGTNIPHRHEDEEEIYYLIRGKGDIVAGETAEKKEYRHPSEAGDAYFFSPGTLIGFYSGNTECEEHARILAVRFKYPPAKK